MHPMSREASPRRRLHPATLSRSPSQEQLFAELQGRLGIAQAAEEPAGASAQDWLTEGVVITVQPRGRRAGGQLVEKVASRSPGSGGLEGPSARVPAGWERLWGGGAVSAFHGLVTRLAATPPPPSTGCWILTFLSLPPLSFPGCLPS